MMRTLTAMLLVAVCAVSCKAQGDPQPQPQPPPPVIPDVKWDSGYFDIYQGGARRSWERFEIIKKGEGGLQIFGEVLVAMEAEEGSDQYRFVPNALYGARGLQKYNLMAKFPIGMGQTQVQRQGGACMLSIQNPGAPQAKPQPVPLPIDGILLDRRIVSQWAVLGLLERRKSRMALDPEMGQVAELRLSDPVPARIETPIGSLLCERVLATMGPWGANLWFDADGRLLRVELPHFGVVAQRRGAYGFPGRRAAENPAAAPVPQSIPMKVQQGNSMVAGEVTLPAGAGPFPAVILLGDAGPQDRDGNPPGTVLQWNHQRDIARTLAAAGVACIRWDDPRTGESVGGPDFPTITDGVADARAVLAWAKTQPQIDPRKLGALGHGEGALIALQLSANGEVPFIALLSSHGASIDLIFVEQMEAELARTGVAPAELKQSLADTRELMRLFLDPKIKDWKSPDVPERFLTMGGRRAWFQDLMRFNPIELAAQVKGPVLLIHGLADTQIPPSQFQALEKAFKDAKKDATCRTFEKLDHLLMPAINGDAGDSADPDRQVSPEVLKAVADWLKAR